MNAKTYLVEFEDGSRRIITAVIDESTNPAEFINDYLAETAVRRHLHGPRPVVARISEVIPEKKGQCVVVDTTVTTPPVRRSEPRPARMSKAGREMPEAQSAFREFLRKIRYHAASEILLTLIVICVLVAVHAVAQVR